MALQLPKLKIPQLKTTTLIAWIFALLVLYLVVAQRFPELLLIKQVNGLACGFYDRLPSVHFPAFWDFGFADPNLVLFVAVVGVFLGIMFHRETL
jgi:hypothetical protein